MDDGVFVVAQPRSQRKDAGSERSQNLRDSILKRTAFDLQRQIQHSNPSKEEEYSYARICPSRCKLRGRVTSAPKFLRPNKRPNGITNQILHAVQTTYELTLRGPPYLEPRARPQQDKIFCNHMVISSCRFTSVNANADARSVCGS